MMKKIIIAMLFAGYSSAACAMEAVRADAHAQERHTLFLELRPHQRAEDRWRKLVRLNAYCLAGISIVTRVVDGPSYSKTMTPMKAASMIGAGGVVVCVVKYLIASCKAGRVRRRLARFEGDPWWWLIC